MAPVPVRKFKSGFNKYVERKWGDGRFKCTAAFNRSWIVENSDGEEIAHGTGALTAQDLADIYEGVGRPGDFPFEGELEMDRRSIRRGFENAGYECESKIDGVEVAGAAVNNADLDVYDADGGLRVSWSSAKREPLNLDDIGRAAAELVGGDVREVQLFCASFNEGAARANRRAPALSVATVDAFEAEEPAKGEPGEDPDPDEGPDGGESGEVI